MSMIGNNNQKSSFNLREQFDTFVNFITVQYFWFVIKINFVVFIQSGFHDKFYLFHFDVCKYADYVTQWATSKPFSHGICLKGVWLVLHTYTMKYIWKWREKNGWKTKFVILVAVMIK